MGFNATEQPSAGSQRSNIEPIEVGTYPARIVGVSIVGLQPRSFNGEAKEPHKNIALTYEFLDEFLKDEDGNDIEDKPRWITEDMPFYNLSSDRAKSTERYLAVDPDQHYEGDWSKLLGAPIMVSVVQNKGKGKHQGKIFNNVDGIAPMRPKEAAKAPELVNEPFLWDFYEPDSDLWGRVPNIIRTICRSAVDFKGTAMEMWDEEYQNNRDQEVKIEDEPAPKKVVRGANSKSVKADDNDW